MKQITKNQLFCLILLYEIGSTTLFLLGDSAKQDSWIVIFLAMWVGFILLWVYTEITKHFPEDHLAEVINILFGKWIAKPLIFLYAGYLFYDACLNFFEFGEIMRITSLMKTPPFIIGGVFIVTVIYMLLIGQQVVPRTAEMLLPTFLFFLLTSLVLSVISQHFDITQLQPILGNGMVPILKALPQVTLFPFGEIVVFLFLWKFVDEKKSIRFTSFLAFSLAGIIIILSQIIIISVLGTGLAANSVVPLLEVILSINLGDIIMNLDVLLIAILFMGGLFKMIINFYGAVLALSYLFNVKNQKFMIILVGICIIGYSFFHLKTLPHQRAITEGAAALWPYTMMIYQIIPVYILIIIILNKKITNQ
ncbi:spore germination protein [Ectobacillus funiculus]|uniref:GerAB/ArcD/ProY family transporter n=1 Tax=Ectobacillus funiculus TaxID=137993 RepID=UPI00397C76F1